MNLDALSVKDIEAAALPHVIPKIHGRKRANLIDYLTTCSMEVQERVEAAAEIASKESNSRKRGLHCDRSRWYRAQQKSAAHPDLDFNLDSFLDLPTTEQKKECRRGFLSATSNEALERAVCASCSRLLFKSSLQEVDYLKLKDCHVFEPTNHHPDQVLSHGMLLNHRHVTDLDDRLVGFICPHCFRAHGKGKVPAYSLANNMWTGDTHPDLADLTLPERLLIALRFPRAYIVKLYLKSGTGTDHPSALQSRLKGNVTTYHTNTESIKQMLQGELMPRRTSILPSLIAVTFIGCTSLAKSRLKSLFRVRRQVVLKALKVLKDVTNHPGYAELKIDDAMVDALPEDAVPEEILATVRWESDEAVAEMERSGYVPEECDPTGDRSSATGDNPNTESIYALGDTAEEPDVIPLEYCGVAAADDTQITPEELLRKAVQNLDTRTQQQIQNEGGYLVCTGNFARDFGPALTNQEDDTKDEPNPSVYIFPHLFPYGFGGLEARRTVPVSFTEHIRCLLQREDTRFQKDPVFPFWALSLEQKRQALHGAQLTMNRKDYDRACATIGQLKVEDYQKATMDEKHGTASQDPKIALLKKMIRVTMQSVMGSDASRALNRSKIWSTSLWCNPVNLWITFNPIDRHDPICQVFAGEQIDMDDLTKVVKLTAQKRAINVAQDPFAATEFFFYLAKTVLQTLLGFANDSKVGRNQMGELGLGNAYFGAVKAQGRGSLHLHLMMWLANSPDADEITFKLQSSDFRDKIRTYMQENIRAHVDGLTQDLLDTMDTEPGLAWGRPPHPDSPTYDQEVGLLEVQLASSQQHHKCTTNTCLQYNKLKGKRVCKRRAPFQLSAEDIVTETGEVIVKRIIENLNSWCPTLFYGGRCNNDIKFITNGALARAIAWYITFYATKKQGTSYNQSAVIERTYAYHAEQTPATEDIQDKNRKFIFRCGMSLNREMEFSGQQAMAYLMGYGDVIHSHTYVTIWWSSVVLALKATYRELAPVSRDQPNLVVQASDPDEMPASPPCNIRDTARVELTTDGIVYLRSQLEDYKYRPAAFEGYFFLEYLVETYEERVKNQEDKDDEDDQALPVNLTSKQGRPQNLRAPYKDAHPRSKTHQRVLRSAGHRTLPNVVGPWFEQRDNPDTYPLHCASVLAALKPWRELIDLKSGFDSWDEALESFLLTANRRQKSIRANMQYYYQCQESADQKDGEDLDQNEHSGGPVNELELQEFVNGVALDDIILSPAKRKEIEHAEVAANIGSKMGFFGEGPSDSPWVVTQPNEPLASDTPVEVEKWIQALQNAALANRQSQTHSMHEPSDPGEVEAMDVESAHPPAAGPSVTYQGDLTLSPVIDTSMLSPEQLRAFKIVQNHLEANQAGDSPDQLLMQIQGAGGTGKSLVISKITELFRQCGKESMLRRSAYTGIAASLIEGSTLHQLALLHLTSRLSKKALTRLRETWNPVHYLIIDEISMVSKTTLADISQMIGIGKQREGENNSTEAFGGVNVILAGDFHQFPPVIGGANSSALYTPTGPKATPKMVIGRSLYEQFTTVVLLKKQFRVDDEKWHKLLTRARYGKCTREDLKDLRKLILDPTRDKGLLASKEWEDAVLVTPRHSVRHRWNELASYSHCRSTGQQLVVSHAYDSHNDKPLERSIKALVQRQLFTGKAADGTPTKGDPGGLPDMVYLAVGMKVMVTYNIETELDVANGARGTIVRIISNDPEDSSVHLKELLRPPICVIVKLWRTKIGTLDGLKDGEVPIVPIRNQYTLKLPNKDKLTLYREQLPLTPAYSFTDYRSQGQTLPYIIMDLATPPTGGLTAFNGYVTLSRSRTARTARLLRDFDDKLFTTPPSQYLEAEDERLEELDQLTKREHQIVFEGEINV